MIKVSHRSSLRNDNTVSEYSLYKPPPSTTILELKAYYLYMYVLPGKVSDLEGRLSTQHRA